MINPLSISHKNDRKLNPSSLCFHGREASLYLTLSVCQYRYVQASKYISTRRRFEEAFERRRVGKSTLHF